MSDLKGIEIHDVFGLSAPLPKLVETVGSAIGEWYKPISVRRMAKAKAFELQAVSEALNNNINLPAEYSAGEITISTQNYEELAKRMGNRLFLQELRKQQNIESIVDMAGTELEKEKSVSSEPVDPDWTIRFFNSVEDVSNEEMQKLWSKVLAGEVKQPKTFSLRSLERLRNMSQIEAALFAKIANYCVEGGGEVFVPSNDDLFDKYGINFVDFLKIEECGLIVSSRLSFKTNPKPYGASAPFIFNQNLVAVFQQSESDMAINLSIRKLTGSGSELYRIINTAPNNQYFLDFFADLRKRKPKVKVTVHKVTYLTTDKIQYSDDDELPPAVQV